MRLAGPDVTQRALDTCRQCRESGHAHPGGRSLRGARVWLCCGWDRAWLDTPLTRDTHFAMVNIVSPPLRRPSVCGNNVPRSQGNAACPCMLLYRFRSLDIWVVPCLINAYAPRVRARGGRPGLQAGAPVPLD